MNILLLASHAVAEFDDLRMFTDLGYDVFAPGGYEVPSRATEDIRPALPDAPHHPELVALCERQRQEYGNQPRAAIDWAKAILHPDLIDWADAMIVHHFPERWIGWQWDRIKHKRVIWRTCGQSDPAIEDYMASFRGLQIVRYSPKERRFFELTGHFAGEDALIRFGKDPDDYGPWIGDVEQVGNVTQNMVERGDACGLSFWREATYGLRTVPAGPGSVQLTGGIGGLGYDEMREYLRHLRTYLYTGTTPASYTLGLIEAMLSGVPIVSIGPEAWRGPAGLFEAHEMVWCAETPSLAHQYLRQLLDDQEIARNAGEFQRQRAVDLFGVETVGAQWLEFLG